MTVMAILIFFWHVSNCAHAHVLVNYMSITCQSHVSLSKLVVITENTTITENPYDGQVRLVSDDDIIKSDGKLEVYLNNNWRAVCSEVFTDTEADSVCRQLGYTNATGFPSVPR